MVAKIARQEANATLCLELSDIHPCQYQHATLTFNEFFQLVINFLNDSSPCARGCESRRGKTENASSSLTHTIYKSTSLILSSF